MYRRGREFAVGVVYVCACVLGRCVCVCRSGGGGGGTPRKLHEEGKNFRCVQAFCIYIHT